MGWRAFSVVAPYVWKFFDRLSIEFKSFKRQLKTFSFAHCQAQRIESIRDYYDYALYYIYYNYYLSYIFRAEPCYSFRGARQILAHAVTLVI